MTSEMDAAALGVDHVWLHEDRRGDQLVIIPEDGKRLALLVRIHSADDYAHYEVRMTKTQARDLILALQQWLATKEGLE